MTDDAPFPRLPWQPIETAPRDGQAVFAWNGERYLWASWRTQPSIHSMKKPSRHGARTVFRCARPRRIGYHCRRQTTAA
jgi:hypothetical protein